MNERLTPESLEAEQSTLGAMLIEADAIARATEMLTAADFYREHHKTIFAAIVELYGAGQPVDIVTLATAFQTRGELEKIGGTDYLGDLIQSCPSSAAVVSYARVVRDKSELRGLIQSADAIQSLCYAGGALPEIKSKAEELVQGASRDRTAGDCESAGRVAIEVLAGLEAQIRNKGRVVGHSTGLRDLDRKMGGLRANHFVVLGARPSLGKSALAMQIAYNVAAGGKPALFFCFEMSKEELVQRLACNLSQVPFERVDRGLVSDEEIGRVLDAARAISRVPLFIQDTSEMTTFDMRSRARRLESEFKENLGVVVVDYLQIIARAATRGHQASTADVLGGISRECHAMGGERGCTVLALSQLSRGVEQRDNKRPVLSDLRDSGAIEAEANRVLFLYRDGYYRNREMAGRHSGEAGDFEDNVAELIIAKNRNGALGTARLAWNGPCLRFDNLAPDGMAGEGDGSDELSPVYAQSGPWDGYGEAA